MSIPAFGWAMQQGRELKLSTALRMLLIAIADRQNGDRYCTAGQDCLADDTGLTTRHVRDLVRELQKLGLIAIERFGHYQRYQVLRAQVAEPSSGMKPSRPEASSGMRRRKPEASSGNGRARPEASSGDHRKPVPVSPVDNGDQTGNPCTPNRKSTTLSPELSSPKPYYNQEREPKSAPASAVTSGAGAPQPEAKVLSSGDEGKDGTPPPAPAKAPTIGAQPAGAAPNQAMRRPGDKPPDSDPDPFRDDGGASKAYASRLLGRTVHLAANDAGRITEDDPPRTAGDRERMAEQLAQLAQSLGGQGRGASASGGALRMDYRMPGRFPALTPEEQIDVLTPQRVKPAPVTPEQLWALRRAAGIPVPTAP